MLIKPITTTTMRSTYLPINIPTYQSNLNIYLSTGLPTYLSTYQPSYLTCLSTYQPTNNHKLCIESGRHRRSVLPREERVCRVCTNNEIEDETHMLFSCLLYNTLREHFLIKQQHILNTTFDSYDCWLNIIFTTENKASIRTTARYICQCFLLRDAASSS